MKISFNKRMPSFSLSLSSKPQKKPQKALVEEAPTAPAYSPASFIESYPLIEPYAYAAITRDPSTGAISYRLIEPPINRQEMMMLEKLGEILAAEMDVDISQLGSAAKREEYLKKKILLTIKRYKIKLEKPVIEKLIYYLTRNFVYLGKLEPVFRDPQIEDISCDGPDVPLYLWHRQYESIPSDVKFNSGEELDKFIARLAYACGRHVSVAQPILDGSLPDGSRVNLTYSTEVTKKGSTFTIRKFRADPFTITDLIRFRTISADAAAYLWYLIEHKASLLIVGGVATGKTTFLNGIAMFIRPEYKIVSIEDTPEINLPHQNWIQGVSRMGFGAVGGGGEVNLFELLRAALRQRPDYIIVGEVRGQEAYTLFQAVATGHGGLTTLHADSVQTAIYRLENEPMNIPRPLITNLTGMVIINRVSLKTGPARRIVNCTELLGVDEGTGALLTEQTFKWEIPNDAIVSVGPSAYIRRTASRMGLSETDVRTDMERRKTILEWMVKSNIRRHIEVARIIADYYLNPERLYFKAIAGL